jgi:UDP-4-keto-D-QuiNAc 4-reductase
VEALGQALGRSPMLLPAPSALLTLGARLLGRPEAAFRLTQSLQVSIRHTQQTLNWNPPCSVEKAMRLTAQEYLGK